MVGFTLPDNVFEQNKIKISLQNLSNFRFVYRVFQIIYTQKVFSFNIVNSQNYFKRLDLFFLSVLNLFCNQIKILLLAMFI